MKVCPVLKSLPQIGALFWRGELLHNRQINREIGRSIGERDAFLQCRIGINHRRSNVLVIGFQAFLEGFDGLVNRGGLEKNLGRPAPDHHLAVGCFLEGLNIGAKLLGQIALVLPLLDIRAGSAA